MNPRRRSGAGGEGVVVTGTVPDVRPIWPMPT
jgi:hypothetical protein